jgi:hypothetical protein
VRRLVDAGGTQVPRRRVRFIAVGCLRRAVGMRSSAVRPLPGTDANLRCGLDAEHVPVVSIEIVEASSVEEALIVRLVRWQGAGGERLVG